MSGVKLPPGITLPLPPEVYAVIMTLPAATAPPGQEGGIMRPHEVYVRGWSLLAVATFITTLAVAIRLFTRWHLPKRWQVEDYLIIVAWAIFIAFIGLAFEAGYKGVGFHLWNLTVGEAIQALKWLAFDGVLWIVDVSLIKVTILLQFLRFFVPKRQMMPLMFWACWFMISVATIFAIILVGLETGGCTPWERIWNPLVPGTCVVDFPTLALASAWVNLAIDVSILILPLPCVFRLKIDRKKKLGIASLFLTGVLACTASGLRLYYTYVGLHGVDQTHYFATLAFCGIYEMCGGALVLCLPTFPKFLSVLKQKHGEFRRRRQPSNDWAGDEPMTFVANKGFATLPSPPNSSERSLE